ncbi:uncharacterized protein [Lepeophtheirus salmonis]|uniref:uncharacterized protein n=1 Tax=Lepeophtheirus salmonis TaxID=72036 RepID=UPI001AE199C2|nr:uncharacterized protein LOC121128579 [Lepeophtheirus salmonis]
MEVTSTISTAGTSFLRNSSVEEHATCSVSVGNPSYLVSEFLASTVAANSSTSTLNNQEQHTHLQHNTTNSGGGNDLLHDGSSGTGGTNFDFEGIDLNSEVPLGEILEKLQESSSSCSISSSSSSSHSEEEDFKKKNQRRINNNVIQLHAEKDDLNGTTISATVNVATLDLSDPESIHRHLSQLNDTVLKVIPTTPNNGNPHLIQQSQKLQPSTSQTQQIQTAPICFLPQQQQRSSTNRRSSSGGKSSPQVCGICSKVFSNASALAKHRLTHSEERRYHCSICGKAFKRQDHLNGHLLTHRSTKPFACTVEGCGKSYCDARSLRRHKENHHPQAPETRNTSHSNNNSNNLLDSIKFSGKGLTPQQFQLIEQIIKESKEGAAAAAAIAAASSSTSGSPISKVILSNGGGQQPQQPVECAICGRKFKNIPALNGHMRLHGGYYKKDAEGRRIPSLTEAALLQQQSLSEKNVGAAKRNSNVQMMHSPALDPPPATAANSPSKAVDSAISSPSLAFRSLPPPDTTKLLANLERKAAAIQQQQQHPRQSPVLQFQPQSELLINNNHISNSKKRRKNDQQTQMAFLPTTPLPPLSNPSIIKIGNQIPLQTLPSMSSNIQVLKFDFNSDKTPKIGTEYQAEIPEWCPYDEDVTMKEKEEGGGDYSEEEEFDEDEGNYEEDRLLWKSKYNSMDEDEMQSYLGFGRSPGVPRAYRRSVEFALYALMRRKGDTKSALRDLMLDVKQNEKELSHFWSDREINGFFRAFSEYQKDFRGIACYIGTKTVFQCVEFYYFWKSLRLKEDIISSSSNLSSSSPCSSLSPSSSKTPSSFVTTGTTNSTTSSTTTLINGSITTIGDSMEENGGDEGALVPSSHHSNSLHGILY